LFPNPDKISFKDENIINIGKKHYASNEDHAIQDMIDMINSYTKVAFKRFVDNIIMQVTERNMIRPININLKSRLSNITSEKLVSLLYEGNAKNNRRIFLTKSINILKEGLTKF